MVLCGHDDDGYVFFFGELLLCFVFEHAGEVHECFFAEYLWPDDLQYRSRADDGVPLHTRYRRTPRKSYVVGGVDQILFRPHLATPPTLHAPPPSARRYWVLNDDVLVSF